MATSAPLGVGLFSDSAEGLDGQLKRVNAATTEKKKKQKKPQMPVKAPEDTLNLSSSLDFTATYGDGAPPVLAAAAWATPNAVPERFSRGRSSRLYLYVTFLCSAWLTVA